MGDYCSKCWNELNKNHGKEEEKCTVAQSTASSPPPSVNAQPSLTSEPVASTKITEKSVTAAAVAATTPKKKKKKKKQSYKNMLAGMMESSGADDKDEKAKIKKTVGGGEFMKIDKI